MASSLSEMVWNQQINDVDCESLDNYRGFVCLCDILKPRKCFHYLQELLVELVVMLELKKTVKAVRS